MALSWRMFLGAGICVVLLACSEKGPQGTDTGPQGTDTGPQGTDDTGPQGPTDSDEDGYTSTIDCDDDDAEVHPGAEEVCDDLDNDCDGEVDEDLLGTWYADEDGDGFGDSEVEVSACEQPSTHVEDDTDCDDGDAQVHPEATESCDELDNDCDGYVDEAVGGLWYLDVDDDGYGDPGEEIAGCEGGEDYVANSGDCDDGDDQVHPDASETCNGVDDDCDDEVDEDDAEDASTWYADDDGDGFGNPDQLSVECEQPSGHVEDDTDCDDLDGSAYPGAEEVCDEVDNDCDGEVDEEVTLTFYVDVDEDGYGDPDGEVQVCSEPTGYVTNDEDCDDSESSVSPGATELCNSVDDDCDEVVDEDEAADVATWYADDDEDGYGDEDAAVESCDAPSGYVDNDDDCDDDDSTSSPAGSEVCDDRDNDCNGSVDDHASDEVWWYVDYDSDGYGSDTLTAPSCSAPMGYVETDDDCDDTDDTVYPGAEELCDGLDNDCDDEIDDEDELTEEDRSTWYADEDGDGYGSAVDAVEACASPSQYTDNHDDCDDTTIDVTFCDSCATVLGEGLDLDDGVYALDPCGSGDGTDFYCDMSTDGGGWTLAGKQSAAATSNLGVGVWGTVTDDEFSSDLDCLVFEEIQVFNEDYGEYFSQSYGSTTWSATETNFSVGSVGDAFKHGSYGTYGTMMGCVDYDNVFGTVSDSDACDNDTLGGQKGHIADYAGGFCASGQLGSSWAWTDGTGCDYDGIDYTWGYAVR